MKNTGKIKFIVAMLLLVMLTGAVLSGCGGSGTYATQKNYVTIGCVAPLSGELAGLGEGSLDLEEAAVNAINEENGIYIDTLERKLKIRFVIADSKSTENGAKEAAKKLIEEDHADVLICSSGAMTATAAASVCESEKVPFFSVNAENDAWLEKGPYKYSVNCSMDNTTRFQAMNDIFRSSGVSSVGLLAVDSEQTKGFTKTLSDFCKKNDLKLTAPDPVDAKSPDFSKAVKAIGSASPDALICYMNGKQFSDVYGSQGLSALGCKVCFLIHDDLLVGDLTSIENGFDVREFYTLTSWDRKYPFLSSLTDETGSELALWWESEFTSSASELAGVKHGAVEIAVNALKLAMALDSDAIVSAAKSLNIDTILGLVDFDENGCCVLPCSVNRWNFDSGTFSWTRELASHAQLVDVEFSE